MYMELVMTSVKVIKPGGTEEYPDKAMPLKTTFQHCCMDLIVLEM